MVDLDIHPSRGDVALQQSIEDRLRNVPLWKSKAEEKNLMQEPLSKPRVPVAIRPSPPGFSKELPTRSIDDWIGTKDEDEDDEEVSADWPNDEDDWET